MMIDEDFKNKWKIETFLVKLKIKKVMILMYYLQINDMIKHKHISIMQTLLKFYENQSYQWRYYMLMMTWIDKITIYKLIDMSLYYFFHNENLILLIKFSMLTWKILL